MRKFGLIRSLCLVLALSYALPAHAVIKETNSLKLELFAKETEKYIEVLLKIMPKKNWRIYSHQPGEFGYPTNIEWDLQDYNLQSEQWSPGEDIVYEGFGVNVYKQPAYYRALLEKGKRNIPGFELFWTACAEECVPESLKLDLSPDVFVFAKNFDHLVNDEPLQANRLSEDKTNLLEIIFMAFLGGLILNFMPCVFPILFLKIVSFTKEKNITTRRKDAYLYLLGVVVCFLIMAGLLSLLRAGGQNLGWGFQLQSPYFLVFLAIVFILLGLMFLDIIKFNFSLKYLPANSFMTGLLAVLIASPCTAPFMGAAVGWTLTTSQSAYIYYPVFLALGLGYALPFFLAELYPGFIKKILPKPGRWMLILKKIFAVPMFVTAAWLGWVLMGQSGSEVVDWKAYQAEEVQALTDKGEKVFVNFTAKWCITCLVNEKTVFNTKSFAQLVKEDNIHLYKADWTSRSSEIAAALAKFGRSSIPLYVYYKDRHFEILPQLLTFGIVKEMLD